MEKMSNIQETGRDVELCQGTAEKTGGGELCSVYGSCFNASLVFLPSKKI